MKSQNLWVLMSVFYCGLSFGSYRVYQLRDRHYDPIGKKKINRMVLSTMDPKQYETFHGGAGVIRVELMDTWYCPGDTSQKKYCKKPKVPEDRGPASLEHPKRIQLPYNRQPVIP